MAINYLASYMAGLLEADGCITQRYKPKKKENPIDSKEIKTYEIHFAFSKDDLIFATFLRDLFNIGQITIKKEEHSVTWSITSIANVINFLSFINGYFRGPKVVILWQALNFVNKKYNLSIPLKPLDSSDILSNSWFAGFSDGDASFQINLSKKEPNTVSLILYYKLEVAELYIKHEEEAFINHKSNSLFMQPIADALKTSLVINKKHKSLFVCAARPDNIETLIKYFEKNPLFSSKYINYKDWLMVLALKNKAKFFRDPLYTIYDEVLRVKNNFNSLRNPSTYTWDHLQNFYKLPLDYPSHQIKLWKRK